MIIGVLCLSLPNIWQVRLGIPVLTFVFVVSLVKQTRDLTQCDTLEGCYLRELETGEDIKLTGHDSYMIKDGHRGYSIHCDAKGEGALDLIKFYYPGADNGNGVQTEYGLPRWMNGDSGKGDWVNAVAYLGSCGPKTVKVVGEVWSGECFADYFHLEAKCDKPKFCDTCGKPAMLKMRYTGNDNTNNSQGEKKSTVAGTVDGAEKVFITASKKDKVDGKEWFSGEVSTGEEFVLNSKSSKFSSNIHVTVRASVDGVPGDTLQKIKLHTSCSVPLDRYDQWGSIQLVDYADEKEQCGFGPPPVGPPSRGPPGADLCDTCDKPAMLKMEYTGSDNTNNSQGEKKSTVAGTVNGAEKVFIIASEKENGGGKEWFSGEVQINHDFVLNATDSKFGSTTYVTVKAAESGATLQMIKLHTSCSVPLSENDQWGSMKLVGYTDKDNCGFD